MILWKEKRVETKVSVVRHNARYYNKLSHWSFQSLTFQKYVDFGEADKFFSELHKYSLMSQNWNLVFFMCPNLLPQFPNITCFECYPVVKSHSQCRCYCTAKLANTVSTYSAHGFLCIIFACCSHQHLYWRAIQQSEP